MQWLLQVNCSGSQVDVHVEAKIKFIFTAKLNGRYSPADAAKEKRKFLAKKRKILSKSS